MMEPSLFLRSISAPSWLPTGAVVPGLSGMIWLVLAGWVLFWCSSEGVSLLLVLLADLCAFSWDLPLDLEIVRDFLVWIGFLSPACSLTCSPAMDFSLVCYCAAFWNCLSRDAGRGCSWLLLLLVLVCSGVHGLFLLLSLVLEVKCAFAFMFLISCICHFPPSFPSRGSQNGSTGLIIS